MNEIAWKKQTIAQFENWSKKKTKFLFKRRIDQVLPFIPGNAIIIDVGCGDAEALRYICSVKKPRVSVGIDARKGLTAHSWTNIFRGDAENLPFKDKSFDCVTVIATIEHLPCPVDALADFSRILKRKGTLIITTPNPLYSKAAHAAASLGHEV